MWTHPDHGSQSCPIAPHHQKNTCTKIHTPISSFIPCFINTPPKLPTVHLYPSLFFPVFSNLSPLCFFLSPLQCNMSTHGQRGECWCVNPFTGVQIPETPKLRGDPNCHQFHEEFLAMPTPAALYWPALGHCDVTRWSWLGLELVLMIILPHFCKWAILPWTTGGVKCW